MLVRFDHLVHLLVAPVRTQRPPRTPESLLLALADRLVGVDSTGNDDDGDDDDDAMTTTTTTTLACRWTGDLAILVHLSQGDYGLAPISSLLDSSHCSSV